MLRVSTLRNQLETKFKLYRCMALDSLEQTLKEGLEEIGRTLYVAGAEAGEDLEFDSGFCGLSPQNVETIFRNFSSGWTSEYLDTLSEGEKAGLILAFLGSDSLRMSRLRFRFPKAFSKWTDEEDSELLRRNAAGESLGSISRAMGRNPNALRMRLEKLLSA